MPSHEVQALVSNRIEIIIDVDSTNREKWSFLVDWTNMGRGIRFEQYLSEHRQTKYDRWKRGLMINAGMGRAPKELPDLHKVKERLYAELAFRVHDLPVIID